MKPFAVTVKKRNCTNYLWTLAFACLLCSAAQAVFAQEHYAVAMERNVAVPMRDGTILRADIYHPQAEGRFPVLLTRTPYDKQDERETCFVAAERGYVAIAQDVRGRFASEGEWYPLKNESADGYDTVEWAAALPYANGKVGMFGSSYVGATQFLAAIAHPPHLAGLFPGETGSDYHDGWVYQGGAFEQWLNESWIARVSWNTLDRRLTKDTNPFLWVEKLPLSSYPVQIPAPQENLAPYFFDWLAHPAYDEYWKAISIEEHYEQIDVPVFHFGAWYDIFLRGTLRNYAGLKARAGKESARDHQRLMIGIGGHAGGGRKVGELDFGPQAGIEEDALMFRWYDSVLKGLPTGIEQDKPVRIFVLGKNEWRDENEWPLARAKSTRYYLQSSGNANSAHGDGSFALQAPDAPSSRDTFVYDPAKPVPTHGGPLCCDRSRFIPAGPADQRAIEDRPDVLVYTTPAFTQDFEVTGPLSLELYASSSALDTDFTAKLVDVWPNGYAQNLAEGILRMRYRNSRERAENMKPGTIYPVAIDMVATSNVFLAGHRLRLEISSSNFPRFDRNLNTGEDQAHATRTVKASNTVWHDQKHPSALVLPVVPQ
ncbi:MAG: CocE/NonD family hydrolase [Acidobacteria bacterium]|nr:CocE/NonD family hydrolase [Acidobacteriota bacterium]